MRTYLQAPETHRRKPVAKTSRERLEKISRHFLGDAGHRTHEEGPFFLPVLLDPNQNDFPIETFVESFQAHGKSACLLSADNKNLSDDSIFSSNRKGRSRDLQSMPDVCLIPLSDPQHPCIAKFGRVLMLVPTSIEGIQQAYVHLKHWSQAPSTPTVGITMLGSEHHASSVWLFSGKLVNGSMSFLKWQPMSFGYLLTPEERGREAPIGLDEVTNLIIQDWLKKSNEPQQNANNKKLEITDYNNLSLSIKTITNPDVELVRRLLGESMTSLGDLRCIDTQPPFEGNCILAIDTRGLPVVINFDSVDAKNALVAGLSAIDELQTNKRWMHRLYPDIFNASDPDKARLIILGPEIPISLIRLVNSDTSILFFSYQVLRVNGKHGLLVDSCPGTNVQHFELNNSSVGNIDKTMDIIQPVEFTEEEESFFGSL